MIYIKLPRKNPRCSAHDVPVRVTVPTDRMGNAYGEYWYCSKCRTEPASISYEQVYFP